MGKDRNVFRTRASVGPSRPPGNDFLPRSTRLITAAAAVSPAHAPSNPSRPADWRPEHLRRTAFPPRERTLLPPAAGKLARSTRSSAHPVTARAYPASAVITRILGHLERRGIDARAGPWTGAAG